MKMDKIKAALSSLLAEDAFGSLTTDKGIIRWEGDDELAIGDAVMTVREDGTEEVAVDGEYLTEDNKIVIKSGTVEAIEELKTEDESAEVVEAVEEDKTPAEDAFARFRSVYELSYDEKEIKIAEAVKAQGYVDCYVIEAGDNYAVVAVYEQEEGGEFSEKFFRYGLKWNEDEVELTEPQEVKPAFVTVEEAPAEEAVEEEYDEEVVEEPTIEVVMEPQEWEKKIAELEERIAKIEEALKNTEVASAEEQYNRINSFSVSDKKDEKIAKMFNLR